jgi:hypothetical protein
MDSGFSVECMQLVNEFPSFVNKQGRPFRCVRPANSPCGYFLFILQWMERELITMDWTQTVCNLSHSYQSGFNQHCLLSSPLQASSSCSNYPCFWLHIPVCCFSIEFLNASFHKPRMFLSSMNQSSKLPLSMKPLWVTNSPPPPYKRWQTQIYDFIFVGCILLRYLYVYFPNIPAIATDNLYFFILFCLLTTYFGPYGLSSGETQQHYSYIYENHRTTAYVIFYNLPIWCTSLIICLPIYSHIMVIISINCIQYYFILIYIYCIQLTVSVV